MPRKPEPSRTYPAFRSIPCGPWLGMTDTVEPQTARPNRAQLLQNCYATTTDVGVAIVGLPGFVLAGTQQGSIGARVWQWFGQFNTANGTKRSLGIINGTVVEYNHGSNTFTTRLSAANITGAGATLSASARVYTAILNDLLIVSDGTNVPFYWDGTNGGGVTPMSNCPVLFGQPVIYYSKVIGIKNAERDTIVWSEEGDPNLGYEAGGYINAWNLGGTYGEPLVALTATNEYLGIIRPRSTTAIFGAVNDQFQTSGTRNSVSERTGTTSPGGALVVDEGTFVLDSDNLPQWWVRGSGYAVDPPLWSDCQTTIGQGYRTGLGNAEVLADDTAGLIWVGYPGLNQTYVTKWLLYERSGGTPNLVGTVTGFSSQRTGVWEDAAGRRRVVHGGVDDGYAYLHGYPGGTDWSFAFAAGSQAIPHAIHFVVPDADIIHEKYYDRLTIESSAADDQGLTVDVQTPNGTTAPLLVTLEGSGSGSALGVGALGSFILGGEGIDQKIDLNIHARGRWAVIRIRHAVLGEEFNVTQAQLEAFSDGREPLVR